MKKRLFSGTVFFLSIREKTPGYAGGVEKL
jgi:hypothetical protein